MFRFLWNFLRRWKVVFKEVVLIVTFFFFFENFKNFKLGIAEWSVGLRCPVANTAWPSPGVTCPSWSQGGWVEAAAGRPGWRRLLAASSHPEGSPCPPPPVQILTVPPYCLKSQLSFYKFKLISMKTSVLPFSLFSDFHLFPEFYILLRQLD